MSSPTENPGYVDQVYLERLAQLAAEFKRRTHEMMSLSTGSHALDVGCGTGADTIPLGRLVGSTGRVMGVDYDPAMVAAANLQAEEAGVQNWVHHDHADATALPYADNSFDATRSERVFQHIADPSPVLIEMVRVTKPGGRIVVVDTDWSSISIDCTDSALDDIAWCLRRATIERVALNSYSGRQLYRRFKDASLVDVVVEPVPFVFTELQLARQVFHFDQVEEYARAKDLVGEHELRQWHEALAEANRRGVFFLAGMVMLASGRKP